MCAAEVPPSDVAWWRRWCVWGGGGGGGGSRGAPRLRGPRPPPPAAPESSSASPLPSPSPSPLPLPLHEQRGDEISRAACLVPLSLAALSVGLGIRRDRRGSLRPSGTVPTSVRMRAPARASCVCVSVCVRVFPRAPSASRAVGQTGRRRTQLRSTARSIDRSSWIATTVRDGLYNETTMPISFGSAATRHSHRLAANPVRYKFGPLQPTVRFHRFATTYPSLTKGSLRHTLRLQRVRYNIAVRTMRSAGGGMAGHSRAGNGSNRPRQCCVVLFRNSRVLYGVR
jgi:hypothetical protein